MAKPGLHPDELPARSPFDPDGINRQAGDKPGKTPQIRPKM
jgi:hypothetical protein